MLWMGFEQLLESHAILQSQLYRQRAGKEKESHAGLHAPLTGETDREGSKLTLQRPGYKALPLVLQDDGGNLREEEDRMCHMF